MKLKSIIIFFSTIILPFHFTTTCAYYTKNGLIYAADGTTVNIDGVNFSGFESSYKFLAELWGPPPFYALTGKYDLGVADLIVQPWVNPAKTNIPNPQSGVKFKTIRLPIMPADLSDTSTSQVNMSFSDSNYKTQGNGVFCATWGATNCTQAVSVSQSLYQVIAELQKSLVRVLVDFHQVHDRDGNVVEPDYSLANYATDVGNLAAQIKTRQITNVIGIDVFNEPYNLNMYQPNGTQPAWVNVIATAATAVYQNNPDLVLFVEGTQDNDPDIVAPICVSPNIPPDPTGYTVTDNPACGANKQVIFKADWGENFKALLDPDQAKMGNAAFNATKFRNAISALAGPTVTTWLLGDPNLPNPTGHLVFSPHVYGAGVATWQTDPPASPYRFLWNFGFLIRAGFPVVIGESGFITNSGDQTFFEQSIVPYLRANNSNHNLFFWTFNSNSGDTGGIRTGQGAALDATKEQVLHNLYSDQ